MPIISPDIQKALRQVGMGKLASDTPLNERLEANNLSLDNALETLSEIMQGGDTNQKLRAVDTTLKLHKVLNDDKVQMPVIQIQINDKFSAAQTSVNPILIPREPVKLNKETLQ